jgi:hypothetical protein
VVSQPCRRGIVGLAACLHPREPRHQHNRHHPKHKADQAENPEALPIYEIYEIHLRWHDNLTSLHIRRTGKSRRQRIIVTPGETEQIPRVDSELNQKVEKKSLNRKVKKKLKNLSYFSNSKKLLLSHHLHHAIHHNLASKQPHQNHHFFQNPLQKGQQNPSFPALTTTQKKVRKRQIQPRETKASLHSESPSPPPP